MSRSAARAVLLIGLGLLAATAAFGSRSAPTLYDGICTADPYRYLSPPPGSASTAAPAGAVKQENISPPEAGQITTTELPPQAQVILPAGGIAAAKGTTAVTFSVTPVQPPAEPLNGVIDGNVYRVSASAPGGPVTITQPMSVVLRSSGTATSRVVGVYAKGRWTMLSTVPVSCAFQWLANTTTLGDYAVIDTSRTSVPARSADSLVTPVRAVGVAVGVLVVLGAAGWIVRGRREP